MVDAAIPSTGSVRIARSHYKSLVLLLLMLIYAMNLIDRLALSILLQDIKTDLALSDTQLGLLTGIAFAFFYAVMGLPIARWADRGNRVTIISLTTAIFSVAVALGGMVTSFLQLLLARICAAVGEAGCQPAALSLISDLFSREERPRAVSRYLLGAPLAFLGGFLVTGWLNQLFGWRATLLIIAVPGVMLALLARLFLVEPRQAGQAMENRAASDTPEGEGAGLAWHGVLRELARNKTYRHLVLGMSLQSFFTTAVVLWQPSFFVRSYGMSTGELGTWLAIVYGTTGALGSWLGGELAARMACGNERRQLYGIVLLFALLALLKPWVYLSADYRLSFALLGLVSLLAAITNGPLWSATQTVVPAPIRATATAVLLLFSNLIGAGLGPLSVGALSDLLHPMFGDRALGFVLAMFSPGYLWAGFHLWLAARHAPRAAIPSSTAI